VAVKRASRRWVKERVTREIDTRAYDVDERLDALRHEVLGLARVVARAEKSASIAGEQLESAKGLIATLRQELREGRANGN
jgi:hypothetical protein